ERSSKLTASVKSERGRNSSRQFQHFILRLVLTIRCTSLDQQSRASTRSGGSILTATSISFIKVLGDLRVLRSIATVICTLRRRCAGGEASFASHLMELTRDWSWPA